MDPGYSLDGLLLFLSRGLACLRLGGTLFVSWNSKGANKDLLEKALVAHNINILERAKIKLRYLVPVAGYYSHIRTKYGGHTIFIPPTIRVGPGKLYSISELYKGHLISWSNQILRTRGFCIDKH